MAGMRDLQPVFPSNEARDPRERRKAHEPISNRGRSCCVFARKRVKETVMFEAIIAKIAYTACDVVHTMAATVNRRLWLLPFMIAAVFVLW